LRGIQAVRHGGEPACVGQRPALVLRDRHQPEHVPLPIDLGEILDVQATMQSRHGLLGVQLEHREVQHVDMKVQHVETAHPPAHFMQHRQMRREIGLELHGRGIEPQRLLAHRDQVSSRPRFRGGEKSHIVSQIDQRIAQPGDDALCAAI
jgi:hypothetical protein